MKTLLFSSLTILSCALLLTTGSCQTTKSESTTADKKQKTTLPIVTIEMENGGIIKFEMYPDTAPKTVARMTELIQQGFYNPKPRKVTWMLPIPPNGLSTTAVLSNAVTFHRVVPGFVAQAGDPTGTGSGGSGVTIPAEFNYRKHVRGTVAMARSQDPNSADSQFYICYGDQPRLDGQYTVFGQVIQGMDVVDKIQQGDKIKKMTVQVPGQKKTTNKTAITEAEKKKIDDWISKNNLNKYGDAQGTMYPGGTPLFNEMTGKRTDVYDYIMKKHPDHPWDN